MIVWKKREIVNKIVAKIIIYVGIHTHHMQVGQLPSFNLTRSHTDSESQSLDEFEDGRFRSYQNAMRHVVGVSSHVGHGNW